MHPRDPSAATATHRPTQSPCRCACGEASSHTRVRVGDVRREVNNSLERLPVQLWPSAVFVYVAVVRVPYEAAVRFACAAVPEPEAPRL